ncbi:MAG: M23 family metallopeptidase [Sphingomonas sp.]|nr:M23 family metallopeptidase [Sphingomonas sp.]
MLQARNAWDDERETGEVVAFPRAAVDEQREFGRRAPREPFSLVVDLHSEDVGPRWFRGVATLALLCGTAFFLAPGFEPFIASKVAATPTAPIRNAQLSELASPDVAKPQAPSIPKPVGILTGTRDGVRRVSGDVANGLYWSLRGAGASPTLAAEYLKAVSTRIDVGEVAPFDRFDFAVLPGRDGEPDRLLYAGLDRAQYSDVQIVKWTLNGQTGWFDGSSQTQQASNGLMAPVPGRITSAFGYRYHPILHYSRFHAGIDFGVAYGSPIAAAADGQVAGAGWAGGYGRQVRIVHAGGLMTTYSHMSAIVAQPGTEVRQGQVIGYVGSSGLSTGPHLHFEVRVGGRPVNPLTAQLVSRPVYTGPQIAAVKARLRQLTSIPMTPQISTAAAVAAVSAPDAG